MLIESVVLRDKGFQLIPLMYKSLMPSTRRQKAKATTTREMDKMFDFENIDVLIGNENTNSLERELGNAIGETSVLGDIESNMHPKNEFRETDCEKNDHRPKEARDYMKAFSNEFNPRLSEEMDSMMAIMH